jgi:hypothetical protein
VIIPECDFDQYSMTLNIDAEQFANKVAKSFMDNQMQDMGPSLDDGHSSITEKTPASTNLTSDNNLSREITSSDRGAGLTLSATSAN